MRQLISGVLAASVLAHACSWDYPIWWIRERGADPLFRFVEKGKAGYLDARGQVQFSPSVEAFGNFAQYFSSGLMHLHGRKFIDAKGQTKELGGPEVQNVGDFSEGLAAAFDGGSKKWGYLSPEGNWAIPPTFPNGSNYPSSFSDGLARIDGPNGTGFIDRKGIWVIPPKYPHASSFHEGMALAIVEGPCVFFHDHPCAGPEFAPRSARDAGNVSAGCKFTYLNQKGGALVQRFDYGRDFSEGLAAVRLGGRWGFIAKDGNWVVQPLYENAESFSDGRAAVQMNGLWGFIDEKGVVVIEPKFRGVGQFRDGRAPVASARDGWRYIDAKGKLAFPGVFTAASPYVHGLAHVEIRSEEGKLTFAYLDSSGREVFRYPR